MIDTTTAADILAKAERIHSELTTVVAQLRAIAGTDSQAPQDDTIPDDLMRPGDVIHEFGVPRSTLHRLCRANPINNAGGFAFFDPVKKRYLISRSKFAAYLRCHGTSWDVKTR
jgi:hypothetical protein